MMNFLIDRASEMTFDIMPVGDLDRFGLDYGTGKASKSHDYLRVYEFFLSPLRDEEFTLLELGVGPLQKMGASLNMWLDYFPKARIVGVDIKPEAKTLERDRLSIVVGDLDNVNFLHELAATYKPAVIIDDASHRWDHQINSFEVLFWALERGGIYIIEDLNSCFGEWAERKGKGQYLDSVSYLTALSCLVYGGIQDHGLFQTHPPSPMQNALAREVDLMAIYRFCSIITKRADVESKQARRRLTHDEPLSGEERQRRRAERRARQAATRAQSPA